MVRGVAGHAPDDGALDTGCDTAPLPTACGFLPAPCDGPGRPRPAPARHRFTASAPGPLFHFPPGTVLIPPVTTARFVLAAALTLGLLEAADRPQYGEAWSRNMTSSERGLPADFDPVTRRGIRWSVPLGAPGSESHSTPVVSGGRVYIGTNNEAPRDPRRTGDRGVFLCLSEKTGELLWQLVVPKREEDIYHDWPKTGMSSPGTVEGDRVYLVDNRGVVLCLDAKGLADGNQGVTNESAYCTPKTTNGVPATPEIPLGPLDADILWSFDLTREVGIWSHDAAHSSILVDGDHLYLNTGNGVDNTHRRIRRPDAPSLVVLDKRTGRLLAQDGLGIGPRIFHCTWSSPAMARIDGRRRIVFAGGDGVLYGFEPFKARRGATGVARLDEVWRFDFDPEAPKSDVASYLNNRRTSPSNIYGMPVVDGDRIYVAGGGDWFWGKNEAWVKCLRAGGKGDTTATSLVWSHPIGRHTMSTPAVAGGMVFAADSMRTFHCIDAATGEGLWTHELDGEVWASALVADSKVYIGTRRGGFYVFALSKEKRLLGQVRLDAPISATPVAANRVLYVGTGRTLYAVAK